MNRLFIFAVLLVMPAMAEEIREVDGTTYRKARVTQVDPDGVVISHEKGVAKVDFVKLPPEMRQRFGYDERKAGIFRRQQTAREDDKRRLLKEYEEREISRIQKQMESGASGDELVYGSKGAHTNAARALAELSKQMEAAEAARIAKEREPVTFWNTPQPVVRVVRTLLKVFASGAGGGGPINGHGCDGGYFPAISHLERSDEPSGKKSP
jgi:hypothetical protein